MTLKSARRSNYRSRTDRVQSIVISEPVSNQAAKIDDFNWFALLDTCDTRFIKPLFIHGRMDKPYWTGRAEYYGFQFDITLYAEDMEFLTRAIGLPFQHKTLWLDQLPDKLDIQIRRVDPKAKRAIGIKAVWNGGLITPDTLTMVKVSGGDNGSGAINDAPTHQYNYDGLPSDELPPEFDWFPPVSQHGIVVPPFKHPRDTQA